MGYCMQQEETRFAIRAENMKHAFGQLQALASRAGAHRRGHFAWVDTSTLLNAKSVQEHLAEWRWDPELDADGNIVSLDFTGDADAHVDHSKWQDRYHPAATMKRR